MSPAWLLLALVFGVNFTAWATIGLVRIADSGLDRFRTLPRNAGSAAHRALRAEKIAQARANGGMAGPAPCLRRGPDPRRRRRSCPDGCA